MFFRIKVKYRNMFISFFCINGNTRFKSESRISIYTKNYTANFVLFKKLNGSSPYI